MLRGCECSLDLMGARGEVVILCLLGALATACVSSHAGRTLGRGVIQGDISLGGPLFTNLGPPVPIPNLPLGVRYGVTDRTDVSAHINVLPIVFGGFMALDVGFTRALVRQDARSGPNLATGLTLLLVTDFREEARLLPVMDLAGGYTFSWFTLFAGFDVMADAWGGGANLSPFAGFEMDLPRRVILHGEFKWFAVNFDVYDAPFRYVSAGDMGMVGFLLGIKFGWDLGREVGDGA